MSDFYDHIYRSYGTYGGVPLWGDPPRTDQAAMVADFTVDAAGDRVYCITTAT